MQRSLQPSSKATSTEVAERNDPTLPAILEFQSPSTAILNTPVPLVARNIALIISSMVLACVVALGLIKVDKVVTATGKVVAKDRTIVVQPLDQAIVRSIEVSPGEKVRAGQLLARLDPTFAAADLTALQAQVSALQAQVTRLQAEAEDRPFTYTGLDPNLSLQAAIFSQRRAEYNYKIEGYAQKASGLAASISKAQSDATAYRDRLAYATSLESMRKELERLNVGSKINTLSAMDVRAEMQRNLQSAEQAAMSAQRDLAALIAERNGYVENWRADVSEKLAEAVTKLSDARESLNKAQLRRQLVELRADRDATVMSVSKVSVGSVLSPGQQFISLVPSNAPLEVEVNIAGTNEGYVRVGDPVAVKFDSFPFVTYGMAYGVVRMISPDSFTSEDEQRNPTGAIAPPSAALSGPGVWFRSRITLDRIDMRDVPEDFALMPGMPVTADIRIGRRTVLGYLLEKVVPLVREGMREP
ncbi:MAG: HlyD family type I secretion periplasmic adaptor subunit [Acetobacteraceae bacterium]